MAYLLTASTALELDRGDSINNECVALFPLSEGGGRQVYNLAATTIDTRYGLIDQGPHWGTGALDFVDATYVDLGAGASYTPSAAGWTLSFWSLFDGNGGYQLGRWKDDTNREFALSNGPTNKYCYLFDGATTGYIAVEAYYVSNPAGQWNHYVIGWNGGTTPASLVYEINGYDATEYEHSSGTFTTPTNKAISLYLGRIESSSTYRFDRMRDFRIWRRLLAPCERYRLCKDRNLPGVIRQKRRTYFAPGGGGGASALTVQRMMLGMGM